MQLGLLETFSNHQVERKLEFFCQLEKMNKRAAPVNLPSTNFTSAPNGTALLSAAKDAVAERCHGYIKPINALMTSSKSKNSASLLGSVELHLNVLAFAVDVSLGVDQADLASAADADPKDEATQRQLVMEHAHDVMIGSGVFDRYIDFLALLTDCDWSVFAGTGGATAQLMLNRMQNSADKSLNFCRYLASSGQKRFFREFFVPFLTGRGLEAREKSERIAVAARALVCQAISMCVNALFKDDETVYAGLSEHPLRGCAEPYLMCREDHKLSTMALILIAFVTDESQSEVFLGARENIDYLVKALREALLATDRRFEGFEVAEAAKCINRLALNDFNKELLVELGLLPVLHQMLGSSNPTDATLGLEILFTMSFCKKHVSKIAIEFEKPLKQAQEDKRWTGSKLLQSLQFNLSSLAGDRNKKPVISSESAADAKHVMISYNHASKKIVQRLYDKLSESGLKVWVDFKDLTKGSTLDAMSAAVESSSVVLMCATRLYKESNNCRLEAEYAWKRNKKLIPLLMEPKYKPTGWLGILMGTELYYDLTDTKYPFEQKFDELLTALLPWLDNKGDSVNLPPTVRADVGQQKTEEVRNWDATRIRMWCQKNNLPSDLLGGITGPELHFLVGAKRRSPEYFGRLLERYFNFDKLLDLARFANALEEI